MSEPAAFRFAPEPPRELAVFPLPGALLLPRGRLPLNIFENRYLHLINDALGEGRMIGMIQPTAAQPPLDKPDCKLFGVGCVGRLIQFSESGDGRFVITLLGVCRFRVGAEIEGRHGYRRVRPDYAGFGADLLEDKKRLADRPRLIKAVRAYFAARHIEGDFSGIDQAGDEFLVNSLSMASPFLPEEKQALLESADLQDRADLLTALLEMALNEPPGRPDTPARH